MGKKVNKTELAEIVGYSADTITAWQSHPTFPIVSKGRGRQGNVYDTADVIQWLVTRETTKMTGSDPDQIYNYNAEKGRLAKNQADHEELRVLEKQGVLVQVDQVERDLTARVLAARAKILAIPQRVAPVAVHSQSIREVEKACRKECEAALLELEKPDGFANTDAA